MTYKMATEWEMYGDSKSFGSTHLSRERAVELIEKFKASPKYAKVAVWEIREIQRAVGIRLM